MWKCRKCGLERARRQSTRCKKGGEHDWGDRDQVYAKLRQETEERRQKATAEYLSFLNSAAGKEQLVKIASGYMVRRRRASLWSLILGLIAIVAIPVGCAAFARLLKSEEIVSLPLLVMAVSFSFPFYFYTSLKKRAKVIPQVRSRETGIAVPIMDAAKFLASRDISRNFAYEDAYGLICLPEPFVPDTSDTEAEWQQKMEHAGKLGRRKKWAEAADEYRKIGNECGLLSISAPAWGMAALCYNISGDERALTCYKNAVLGYKKLANQGHEGAQEKLAEAEQKLAEFLNRNAQAENA
jgi:hypothetical protein